MPRQSAPQSVPGPRALPAVLVVCQDGETSRRFGGLEGLVLAGGRVASLRSLRGDPEEPGRGRVAEGRGAETGRGRGGGARQAQLGRRRPWPAWDTHGFPGLCEGLWAGLYQG